MSAASGPWRSAGGRLHTHLHRGAARPATPAGARLAVFAGGAQRLLGSAAAMLLCMTAYGVLQELVMSRPFGSDEAGGRLAEYFDFSLVLVLANRLVTCAVAGLVSVVSGKEGGASAPPLRTMLVPCLLVAATNGAATFCQYEALRFVSFAGVTLAKSAKTLPVLLWGTLVLRKRYKRVDFLAAVGVALGCALFATSGVGVTTRLPAAAAADGPQPLRAWLAAALLVAYLAFDGLTSSYQELLFRTHATLTAAALVTYVSAAASGLALAAALISGQLPGALSFAAAHPEVAWYVAGLSLASAGASLLINDTIRRFGALAFAGIMTSRQLLSVAVSAAAFRHPISAAQWAGAALIFVSLYARLVLETHDGGAGAVAKVMRSALPDAPQPPDAEAPSEPT